ncbi:MAG: porin [Planctomycetaceae bacterium]|nr:porin [Planctomycetaceae bacterium]
MADFALLRSRLRSRTVTIRMTVVLLCVLVCSTRTEWASAQSAGDQGFRSATQTSSFQTYEASPSLPTLATSDTAALDARFEQMQQELDALRMSLNSVHQQMVPKAAPAPTFPTAKLTGFFQADAGWLYQDSGSLAQFGDIQDNRGFRRARLAATGKVAENMSYMLEMDFAVNGRPSFMDVWGEVSDVPVLGNVRVGQYRMPFGLDELTSVKELTFLERPVMFGMGPFRQIGAGFHDSNEDQSVTWAASGFGTGTDFWGNSIGDRGYGTAERVTGILYEDTCSQSLVHIGFGHSYLATPNNLVQFRNVPEFGGPFGVPGTIPVFVDTGALPAENTNLLNAELAGTWGSFHAQSELRYALVNLNNGATAAFPSFYAQGGYILTGEHRPYNKANAVLGRIKPKQAFGKCGMGAWEVAARYSWMNLNDAGIPGGELNNISGIVNWYLNDYSKVQFMYINADLNRAPAGSGQTDIVAMRFQVDF